MFEGLKVGLALGCGGLRGVAHFGVIKALVRHDIKISYIAGTSSGSVIGAILAAGKAEQGEAYARHLTWWKLIRLFTEIRLPRSGILTGRRIVKALADIIQCDTFEELDVPFAVVATDLYTGEGVIMKDGNLLTAVSASCAVPIAYRPVRRQGRWLADGGMVNPLPVSVCRDMGADMVIAVDVNLGKSARYAEPPEKYPSLLDSFTQTSRIIENEWTRHILAISKPDILIQPITGAMLVPNFNHIARAIIIGEKTADKALDRFMGRLPQGPKPANVAPNQ